jgi:hypothetical protein
MVVNPPFLVPGTSGVVIFKLVKTVSVISAEIRSINLGGDND